jgi:hypothetical protein
MKKLLVGLAVLSMASVASAALQIVVEAGPALPSDTEYDNYTAYDIYFRAGEPGSIATSFEGRLDGPMLQLWYYKFGSYTSTEYLDDVLPNNHASGYQYTDTRLMFLSTKITQVSGYTPKEDYDQTTEFTCPLDPDLKNGLGRYFCGDSGVGTNMLFVIDSSIQSTNFHFMRVVVPDGTAVTLSCDIAAVDVDVHSIEDQTVIIPEPATIGLLLLGGAGALVRRRRR